MQARHGRERVVEEGREVALQGDAALGAHRVVHAHARQPRRGGREEGVDRQGDHPAGDQGVAQDPVDRPRAPVDPDHDQRDHDRLRQQVDPAERGQPDRAVQGALGGRLDVDAEDGLRAEHPVGVLDGQRLGARRHGAAELVDEVGRGEDQGLAAPPSRARRSQAAHVQVDRGPGSNSSRRRRAGARRRRGRSRSATPAAGGPGSPGPGRAPGRPGWPAARWSGSGAPGRASAGCTRRACRAGA